MGMNRKMIRELQLQGRKALRIALKDSSVRDFITDQIKRGSYNNYMAGVEAGKEMVIHAADHLEYTL